MGRRKTKSETNFQSDLRSDILKKIPGSQVFKLNPGQTVGVPQGWPDLLILYKEHWAALEVKKSEKATHQPNQDLYTERISAHTYASFISPENKEEVLNELARSFGMDI